MSKKLLLFIMLLTGLYFSLSSYSGGPGGTITYDGTGARASAAGCSCHGTAASTTSVTLALDSAGTPVTHYVAGQTYNIKLTGTQTSSSLTLPKFGFQLTAVSASGAGTSSATNAGTLATSGLPSGTANRAIGSFRFIEHTTRLSPASGTGGAGTVYSVSIPWTAPTSGSGGVKLFAVLNAVNVNFASDAGDKWNTTNTTLTEENAPITGPRTLCTGNTLTLACATSGGTWTSSDTTIASVSTTGLVSGIAAGTVAISYTTAIGTSIANVGVTTTPVGGVIIAPASLCVGATTTLTDSGGTAGGTWTSGSTSIATVNVATGLVRALAAGTAHLTYTITNSCGTASATTDITVLPLPTVAPITGTATLCAGATTTLADTTAGGNWSTGAAAIASVDAGTGTVYGLAGGSATISYSVANTCGTTAVTRVVTVNPGPTAGSISGASVACLGAGTITYTIGGASGTGTWVSSNPSVASINSSGVVTTSSLGTATISYVVSNACGTNIATHPLSVTPTAYAGTIIAGTTNVCVTSSITLVDSTPGGTWSSSASGIAVVSGGIVTGVTTGSAVISYTVINSCGTAVATKTVTVSPLPNAGTITIPAQLCVATSLPLTVTGTGGALTLTNTHATLSGYTIIGVSAGIDTAVYTTTNSCGSATATRVIPINPTPNAGTITGTDHACAGITVALANAVTGGTWSNSSPTICTVSPTGSVKALAPGFASISYSKSNSCGTAMASFAFTVPNCFVGINDIETNTGSLLITPNPNTGSFVISLNTGLAEDAVVVITNVLGEKVAGLSIHTNKQYDQNLPLAKGIYFISATTQTERLTSKIIIE